MQETTLIVDTPLGLVTLVGTEQGLTEISFGPAGPEEGEQVPECLYTAALQLQEYFQGQRTGFDLALIMQGTSFQVQVWKALMDIPYGHRVSYRELACRVGNPRACRAVGGANNKNPFSVVVPCHRVVGSDGRLVGYASGLWRKQWLLELEGAL